MPGFWANKSESIIDERLKEIKTGEVSRAEKPV